MAKNASVRTRSKQESSSESIAKLIQATIDCIVKLSYARTTTVDIVSMAGLTRGALQHHYDSREDLILATWLEIHRRFLLKFDNMPGKRVNLEGRIDYIIKNAWALYTSSEYMATTEIRLGTRADNVFSHKLKAAVEQFNILYEQKWQETFAGFADPEKIELAKRVIGGSLRGLALQKITERNSQYYSEAIAACNIMLQRYLQNDRYN
jgi:AcrR family transcriptional regulator